MASTPVDPLQTLSAALAVPADSREQADLLASLRSSLEAHPGPIPILCTTLIPTVAHASDSLLKRWVLDLLHFDHLVFLEHLHSVEPLIMFRSDEMDSSKASCAKRTLYLEIRQGVLSFCCPHCHSPFRWRLWHML